ncbi:tetratricopeptide repeat protein [Nitrospirota bacterium]
MSVLRTGVAHHIFHDGEPKVAVAAAWYANQLKTDHPVILTVLDFIETEHTKVLRRMDPPMQDMKLIDQYLFTSLNHIYEGRFDLAVDKCAIILAIDRNNVMAMKRMGSAYFLMGSKKRAEQVWKSALRIAPDDSELTEFLEMLL